MSINKRQTICADVNWIVFVIIESFDFTEATFAFCIGMVINPAQSNFQMLVLETIK